MLRFAPGIAIALLALPVIGGLAGTLLPAFGYLPALGGGELSLEPFRSRLAQPGLLRSCLIALAAGVVTAAISTRWSRCSSAAGRKRAPSASSSRSSRRCWPCRMPRPPSASPS
jgi:hypothetical protein